MNKKLLLTLIFSTLASFGGQASLNSLDSLREGHFTGDYGRFFKSDCSVSVSRVEKSAHDVYEIDVISGPVRERFVIGIDQALIRAQATQVITASKGSEREMRILQLRVNGYGEPVSYLVEERTISFLRTRTRQLIECQNI
jgi:hypothetical protein